MTIADRSWRGAPELLIEDATAAADGTPSMMLCWGCLPKCSSAKVPSPSLIVVVIEYRYDTDDGFDYDVDNERPRDFRRAVLAARYRSNGPLAPGHRGARRI
jgi:hypothetical protein